MTETTIIVLLATLPVNCIFALFVYTQMRLAKHFIKALLSKNPQELADAERIEAIKPSKKPAPDELVNTDELDDEQFFKAVGLDHEAK